MENFTCEILQGIARGIKPALLFCRINCQRIP